MENALTPSSPEPIRTWGEFTRAVEALGVRDETEMDYIDVDFALLMAVGNGGRPAELCCETDQAGNVSITT